MHRKPMACRPVNFNLRKWTLLAFMLIDSFITGYMIYNGAFQQNALDQFDIFPPELAKTLKENATSSINVSIGMAIFLLFFFIYGLLAHNLCICAIYLGWSIWGIASGLFWFEKNPLYFLGTLLSLMKALLSAVFIDDLRILARRERRNQMS